MIETKFFTDDYTQEEIEEIEKELNILKSAIRTGLSQHWSTIHNEARDNLRYNEIILSHVVWAEIPRIKDSNFFVPISERNIHVFRYDTKFIIDYRFRLSRRIAYQEIRVVFNSDRFINTKEYYDVIEEG